MFFKKKKKSVEDVGIIVKENSMSSKIEGYNRLKDNILYLNADGTKKVIQVESSVSHEGKTTIACNLAVSLGLTDKKVVVVDLDFRRPRVQQRFDISIDNGISEYMLGTLDKKDTSVREYLAERADLLGAIRLPNNAFSEANTEVTSDIIFLQKTTGHYILMT